MTGHYVPIEHARVVGAVRAGCRSLAEVARWMGFKTRAGAKWHVDRAVRAGVLTRGPKGASRTLALPR